ncbi:hypothetical protein OJF2_14060 [Aquisphaera giovannonii]|uniref:Uncharacterized protein n=1 Tax=Aquisphaera giovannonii TaxID=406548 RepID=A0A5B9VYC3_9BACT|nr:hypothetical protein [Aquisphaera giovannonii]QEH32921.1 hypothetical protein OJF2_14060 [Aquisphaera giovannonii]
MNVDLRISPDLLGGGASGRFAAAIPDSLRASGSHAVLSALAAVGGVVGLAVRARWGTRRFGVNHEVVLHGPGAWRAIEASLDPLRGSDLLLDGDRANHYNTMLRGLKTRPQGVVAAIRDASQLVGEILLERQVDTTLVLVTRALLADGAATGGMLKGADETPWATLVERHEEIVDLDSP